MLTLACRLVTGQLDVDVEADEYGVEHKVDVADDQEKQHTEYISSVLFVAAFCDLFWVPLPKNHVAVNLP